MTHVIDGPHGTGQQVLASGGIASGTLPSGTLSSAALASVALRDETPAAVGTPVTAGAGDAADTVAIPHPRTAPAATPAPASSRDGQREAVPATRPPGPVLPMPPQDDEKYHYVRRGAWILTLASIASFPRLLFSQTPGSGSMCHS